MDDIRQAFRRLASEWHPDRNQSSSAPARMQELNRAYELLSQREQKRRTSTQAEKPQPRHEGKHHKPANESARADARTGSNIRRKIRLTLEEAAFGCSKMVKGRITDLCASCFGTGTAGYRTTCRHCAGGGNKLASTCHHCDGTGEIDAECPACNGRKTRNVIRDYAFSADIPAGVLPGQIIRFRGKGQQGAQAPLHGDFLLEADIVEHAYFAFDPARKLDLRVTVPVHALRWLLGGSLEVPTLLGTRTEPFMPMATSLQVHGAGYAGHDGIRGDLIVTLAPGGPDALTIEQQEQLGQLACETTSGALAAWSEGLAAWKAATAKRR
jgi:molecular chaperone DnaJ